MANARRLHDRIDNNIDVIVRDGTANPSRRRRQQPQRQRNTSTVVNTFLLHAFLGKCEFKMVQHLHVFAIGGKISKVLHGMGLVNKNNTCYPSSTPTVATTKNVEFGSKNC